MAERLARDQSLRVSTSRPERTARGLRGWLRRALILAIGLAWLAVLAVVLAHVLVVRTPAKDVPAARLVPDGMPARVLVVLARPGQEVPMAGTLAALDAAGVQVRVVALTRGEAQEPRIDLPGTDLGAVRADESQRAGAALGVDDTTVHDLPDGNLLAADPDALRGPVQDAVTAFHPSVLLTVADLTSSDTDSRVVSATSVQIAQAKDSGIAQVWSVTRSGPERSWLLRGKAEAGNAAPDATVAVRIADVAALKDRALVAHGTMSPTLAAHTYPMADRLPARAYFRFWDREYFALTWGQPLA